MRARVAVPCRSLISRRMVRLLFVIVLLAAIGACNRNQPGVVCAPLTTATLIRVSESGSPARQFDISDRYRIQALVDFANGRRQGFSARRKSLPSPTSSAIFYDGSQSLLTFSAGPNFFSLSCSSYAGVQEANRVQIAEFERLLTNQP